MGRFYCDYCQLYLTPDAASVRKNHLTGRNHVKLVCDYYEKQAKDQGLWSDPGFNYDNIDPYKGIPGSEINSRTLEDYYKLADAKILPLPHSLQGFPNPPAKVLYETLNKSDIDSILKVSK